MMDLLGFLNLKAKVASLLVFILAITGFVAWSGINSMQTLSVFIEEIAEHDIPLIEHISALEEYQMSQAIQYEKAIRFAELMAVKEESAKAFKQSVAAFEKLAEEADLEMEKVGKLNQAMMATATSAEAKEEIRMLGEKFALIAKLHDEYQEHVIEIFELFGKRGNA